MDLDVVFCGSSPLQVKVKVYVFTSDKTKFSEPDRDLVPSQSPLALQLIVFVVVQVKSTELPTVIELEEAINELIIGLMVIV
jgi:hypothetical protein